MQPFIERLARYLWPGFAEHPERDQLALLANLMLVVISLPGVVVGLAVLLAVTDGQLLRAEWLLFLLLLVLSLLLTRVEFFRRTGREAGQYSYISSDLEWVLATTSLLILGPTAIWIHLANRALRFAATWRKDRFTLHQRLAWFRNLLYNLLTGIVSGLALLVVYRTAGGRLPLPGLGFPDGPAAGIGVAASIGTNALFLLFILRTFAYFLGPRQMGGMGRQTVSFFFVAHLPAFFGILGAALYSQMGISALLFFAAGLLLVSLLARRLSRTGMESQQRAAELAQLEELGRAIIETPADITRLSALLAASLPQMFDYRRAEIRLFSGEMLVALPAEQQALPESLWQWYASDPRPVVLDRHDQVPGHERIAAARVLLVPILSSVDQEPVGGIALALAHEQAGPGAQGPLLSLQVLAAQVASALHRIEIQAEMLAYERVRQELAFARQIQASFLPDELPTLPGWQLSASLQPARQTSGDFYDVIPLPGDKVGLVMADVADKGMGAALFMALSRTLVRTYAGTYPDRPGQVLAATNARILADTSNDMFVTVFYGVLDPRSGRLHYANAGHNPPYLGPQPLPLTGMPLGILADARWESRQIRVALGETLVLYTDGVSEAHNGAYAEFGTERLLATIAARAADDVALIAAGVQQAVAEFVGDASQSDDMTLLLLRREAQPAMAGGGGATLD